VVQGLGRRPKEKKEKEGEAIPLLFLCISLEWEGSSGRDV